MYFFPRKIEDEITKISIQIHIRQVESNFLHMN